MEAAEHNLKVLERQKFDLQEIITGSESENTPIRPGSEFRPIHFLDRILQNHPLWPRARRTMTRGFTMPLVDIPEADWERDVKDALIYGNHKSTLLNPTVVLPSEFSVISEIIVNLANTSYNIKIGTLQNYIRSLWP
jgi:hypothetical protein